MSVNIQRRSRKLKPTLLHFSTATRWSSRSTKQHLCNGFVLPRPLKPGASQSNVLHQSDCRGDCSLRFVANGSAEILQDSWRTQSSSKSLCYCAHRRPLGSCQKRRERDGFLVLELEQPGAAARTMAL